MTARAFGDMTRTWSRAVMAVMCVAALSGCGSAPPVPQDKFYRLQAVSTTAPSATPKLDGTLEIERFSADGLTAGRPIVYAESNVPNQLLEYHYHFWTQPPTIMLQDELIAYLRAANYARNVVTPEMRITPDYALTGRIRRFEQVLGSPDAAVIELEISLRRIDDGKLMLLKTYRHESKQSSRGVPGAVAAMNEALNIIYSDLLADLRTR